MSKLREPDPLNIKKHLILNSLLFITILVDFFCLYAIDIYISMYSRDFRQYLKQLRASAGLSNRDLAARAGVPHSFIAGLQAGSRRVGEIQARKIGAALGLNGENLEEFVLLGVDTCTEKVLNTAKGYPASLLNLIATQLRVAGIFPELLSRCVIQDAGKGQHISLHLHNGKTAHLMTELAMS